MKRFSLLYVGALAGLLVSLAPSAVADDYDKKTVVTTKEAMEVPGAVLQPGTYVFKLLNASSNRHIIEIMNERENHLYALSFTAAAQRLEPLRNRDNKIVLTFYEEPNGQPQAVKRWYFPGDSIGQEFIYPKNQAARISAATNEKVPEGNLPTVAESGQSLTPDNVNGLSSDVSQNSGNTNTTATSVTEPAAPAPLAPALVAQAEPAPQSVDQTPQSNSTTSTSSTTSSTDTPQQSAATTSSDKALPQTASQLPLIAGIGIVSLAGALLVGFMKRRSVQGL